MKKLRIVILSLGLLIILAVNSFCLTIRNESAKNISLKMYVPTSTSIFTHVKSWTLSADPITVLPLRGHPHGHPYWFQFFNKHDLVVGWLCIRGDSGEWFFWSLQAYYNALSVKDRGVVKEWGDVKREPTITLTGEDGLDGVEVIYTGNETPMHYQ